MGIQYKCILSIENLLANYYSRVYSINGHELHHHEKFQCRMYVVSFLYLIKCMDRPTQNKGDIFDLLSAETDVTELELHFLCVLTARFLGDLRGLCLLFL